jgi:hypothetical protein
MRMRYVEETHFRRPLSLASLPCRSFCFHCGNLSEMRTTPAELRANAFDLRKLETVSVHSIRFANSLSEPRVETI